MSRRGWWSLHSVSRSGGLGRSCVGVDAVVAVGWDGLARLIKSTSAVGSKRHWDQSENVRALPRAQLHSS